MLGGALNAPRPAPAQQPSDDGDRGAGLARKPDCAANRCHGRLFLLHTGQRDCLWPSASEEGHR